MMVDGVENLGTGFVVCNLTVGQNIVGQNIWPFRQEQQNEGSMWQCATC